MHVIGNVLRVLAINLNLIPSFTLSIFADVRYKSTIIILYDAHIGVAVSPKQCNPYIPNH